MPGRIVMTERIVGHVGVTIQRLGIDRLRHNRIRTHKPPQLRVIPTRVVVTQPLAAGQTFLVILSREALAGQVAEGGTPIAAERVVEFPFDRVPAPVHDDAGRAQMVAQQAVDAVVRGVPAAPERDRSVRPGVVRGRRARLPFVDPADVDRGHAVDRAYGTAAGAESHESWLEKLRAASCRN